MVGEAQTNQLAGHVKLHQIFFKLLLSQTITQLYFILKGKEGSGWESIMLG